MLGLGVNFQSLDTSKDLNYSLRKLTLAALKLEKGNWLKIASL